MPRDLKFFDYPEKERVRALAIHRMCEEIDKAERLDGRRLKAIESVAKTHASDVERVDADQVVKVGVSAKRLYAIYSKWLNQPGPMACIRNYVTPPSKPVPPELIIELRRLAGLTGNPHGKANIKMAIEQVEADWNAEKAVPGLGTPQEWWAANHKNEPWPGINPPFPIPASILRRRMPNRRQQYRTRPNGFSIPAAFARYGLIECANELRGQLETPVPSSETLRILDALLCLLGTTRNEVGIQLQLKGNVIRWAFESGKMERAQEVRRLVIVAVDAHINNYRQKPT